MPSRVSGNPVDTDLRRNFLLPDFRTSVGIDIKFCGILRNFERKSITELRGIPCTEFRISLLSTVLHEQVLKHVLGHVPVRDREKMNILMCIFMYLFILMPLPIPTNMRITRIMKIMYSCNIHVHYYALAYACAHIHVYVHVRFQVRVHVHVHLHVHVHVLVLVCVHEYVDAHVQ